MHITKITTKLLHDLSALVTVAFAGVLAAEIILPGFLTRFVTLTEIVIAIAALLGTIALLTRHAHTEKLPHMKTLHIALLLTATGFALLPTMRSFAWYEILVVLALTLTTEYLLLKKYYTK